MANWNWLKKAIVSEVFEWIARILFSYGGGVGMLEVIGKWLLNLPSYYSAAIILIVVIALFIGTPKILRWIILKTQLGKVRIADGIEYYPSRKVLGLPEDVFRKTQRAYALWFTGAGTKRENIHKQRRFERIIFMNPQYKPQGAKEGHYLSYRSYLSNKAHDTLEGVERVVKLISKEAHETEAQVKWLDGIPSIIMAISNLKAPEDWILLEVIDFTKAAQDWGSYKIYESQHPLLCQYLRNMYEYLWELSKEPDWSKL